MKTGFALLLVVFMGMGGGAFGQGWELPFYEGIAATNVGYNVALNKEYGGVITLVDYNGGVGARIVRFNPIGDTNWSTIVAIPPANMYYNVEDTILLTNGRTIASQRWDTTTGNVDAYFVQMRTTIDSFGNIIFVDSLADNSDWTLSQLKASSIDGYYYQLTTGKNVLGEPGAGNDSMDLTVSLQYFNGEGLLQWDSVKQDRFLLGSEDAAAFGFFLELSSENDGG